MMEFFGASDPRVEPELLRLNQALQESKRIVGLIGAGASTSAGCT